MEVEVAAVFVEVPGLQAPQTSHNFKEESAGTTPSTTPSPDLAGGSPQIQKNSRLTLNHVETVTPARLTVDRASAGLLAGDSTTNNNNHTNNNTTMIKILKLQLKTTFHFLKS